MRKTFLFFLISVLAGWGCSNHSAKNKVSDKPNILVIVADDLGYSDLSFLPYASSDVSTPNIDRIAENGVFFTDAYSTAPICSPSRAGLITGRFQERWGNYWFGEGGLPANEKTLPQRLKHLGYHSVKIGKTHLNGGPVEHPMDHGFDDFLGFIDHTWDYLRLSQKDADRYGEQNARLAHIGPLWNGREKQSYEHGYTTDIFTQKAVDVIQQSGDKPWYIELEFNAVHHPTYVCHPDYLEKYGIEQFPFWNPEEEPYNVWHKKWGNLGEIDPDGRTRYRLQLEVLDNGIGKILESLKSTGQLENTLLVFMSDNGGTINTYSRNLPLNGYKYMLGEGGIRIPMIISFPQKIKSRQKVSQMVSALDVLPTILAAAGGTVTAADSLDGQSLWPVIDGKANGHDALFWDDGRGSWAVRKGKWKLVSHVGWEHLGFVVEDGTARRGPDYSFPAGTFLFNLETDLTESVDLASQYPEKVKELTVEYQQWRNQMSDPRTRDGKLKRKKAGKKKSLLK